MRKSKVGQIGCLCALLFVVALYSFSDEGDKPVIGKAAPEEAATAEYRTESLRGQVVWLADALERRFNVKTVPEVKEHVLALETKEGRVFPIVEDLRGHSFRTDERLRVMPVELLVRRYRGSSLVQVIRIYEIKDDAKYLVDYWCDVCSIVMFETGPCECCQDHNRLRKRLLDKRGNPIDQ